MAYTGHMMNTDNSKGKKFARLKLSPQNKRLRQAQSVLDSSLTQAEEKSWQSLSQALFKSATKASLESCDGLELAIDSVLDWSTLPQIVSANLRSTKMMELLDWQKQLLSDIEDLNPKTVYVFSKHEVNYFWVVSEEPSTEKIMKFSTRFINVLDYYPKLICDFLVYGENEIDKSMLPENCIVIERG